MTIIEPQPELYTAARTGTVFVQLERGVISARGNDRLDLLHRLSTNATLQLQPLEETTTILTSDKGRIVEVVRVLALEDSILMILMGAEVGPTIAWLDRYTIMDDFTTADATPEYAVLGLHGEQARMIISGLLESPTPDSGHFLRVEHRDGKVIALRDNRISGAGGFLLLVSRSILEEVIGRLEDSGARRIDNETFETLRIEAGQPAMGRELTEVYNPLEANLVQLISWTKGCYIGQEVIARLDTYDKVQRHLVGIVLEGRIEAGGTDELGVIDPVEGKSIGKITSLAWSPSLDAEIALAYIRTQYAIPGAEVAIVSPASDSASARLARGRITRLPFDL